MDYEMDNVDNSNNKDVTDKSLDVEWQIDSEWISLSSSPSLALPANKKKGKKPREDLTDIETEEPPNFHFISPVKGGRFLVVDNKTLRLSQKKETGYSYWVCSIPCCTARCVLDPEEKKIVRFCRDHNHEAEISRQEYKKFINALKISVKENPHVKPIVLYDMELEKAKERWRENNLKNNTNEEEPCLPSFEAVRTAMYNSRNAVLSAVSLKATEDERVVAEAEPAPNAGPSRSTRSRDTKAYSKRKAKRSKTLLPSSSDLDELEEEWSSEPHKDADLSDFETWLEDDVNANITAVVVSPSKEQGTTPSRIKKTPARLEVHDLKPGLSESEEDEENDDDELDEDWKDSSSLKSNGKQNCEDVNFYFMPSSRGCQVLVIDGCLLHQNTIRTSGKSYWRCQKKGCFYRAVYDPRMDKVTKTTGLHNHPPDSNQMIRRQFINNVKYQIMEHPHIPARQIYEKEVHKVQQELEELGVIWKVPPFSCVKHHAYRARRIATRNEDDEEEDEDVSEEQPIKREITETEKKFLEESAHLPQEEETGQNISLLSPGPSLIQSNNFPDLSFYFIPSKKGKRILVVNDFTFRLNSLKSGGRYYWKCTVDPCMFRCVYNENLKDLVKVSGKHTHTSNVNRLRMREFCFLMKARMAEDLSLTPKKAYDQEIAKIRSLDNGETLIKCLPAYSSIRTSLYNQKHKTIQYMEGYDIGSIMISLIRRAMEDEQGLQPGSSAGTGGNGYNNYCTGSSACASYIESSLPVANLDQAQDISPKDITHLSLEDNDPMEHEDEERGASVGNSSSSNLMEIAAPSLYDNHDIIDQYCSLPGKMKSVSQEEIITENQVITMPDPSIYSLSFVPTTRGGRALVVNGCVLRISYTRDYVTYWRCLNNDCNFRCSYDSKGKKLLRISGEHNHAVNRYSPIIRTFVKRIKKRVCQESDLSPKIIYDEELERLKGDGKGVELIKRLPSYDSLKSALYKVKSKSTRASTTIEESVDYLLDDSEDDKDDESSTDTPDSCRTEDPPYDPCIEEGFSLFSTQLPFWLEQDTDKRLLDGHLLIRKSVTETSTGWACTKEDCPFRCVVDNDTNAVTRSQWDHTHKSLVKHTIAQAMFNAVKRRAIMDLNISPKVIYEQERKRIIDKLSGNKILIKFIPNLTQVYQLVTKTRANPPPPPKPKVIRTKFPKQMMKKKSSKSVRSNSSNNYGEVGQFDTDYLLDHCEDDGERVSAYIEEHQQQNSLMYGPSNMLPASDYNATTYQQTAFHHNINSFTNSVSPDTNTIHTDTFNSLEQHTGFNSFTNLPNKPSHYVPIEAYLLQHQQQLSSQPLQQQRPSPLTISAQLPQQPSPLMTATEQKPPLGVQVSQNMAQIPHAVSSSSENMLTFHGYPLLATTTSMNNTYWQCQVPECRFQCVLSAGSSQIVQISGSHNHEPPGSQSAFYCQVVKVLQRKAAENVDKPLSSVYWEYINSLRNVLDSEEIMGSLPRFQDVALAMQSSRTAMEADDSSHQLHNLIMGNATHSNRVYEFHFDEQCGALVINGNLLVNSWRMNEISYWRCKTADCRFKCALDEELQCVHIFNPHTHQCPSGSEAEDINWALKRKCPDKPPRRLKIQRIE